MDVGGQIALNAANPSQRLELSVTNQPSPLLEYIIHGREERNLEYKQSMNWDDPGTKAKVSKSCMAMANTRGGGVIVFGMSEARDSFDLTGMSQTDLTSFRQDSVAAEVNNFAAPFVELTLTAIEHQQRGFLVIQVAEFSESPVICRRDGPENLIQGAIYTRSRRINESAPIRLEAEMRELLDLAVEKGVLRIQQLLTTPAASQAAIEQSASRFEEQLGSLR